MQSNWRASDTLAGEEIYKWLIVLDKEVITLDTEGIISIEPITVRKVVLFPNAASDAATFTFWQEGGTEVTSQTNVTTSVTASSNTFSSTGNFPTATINPNQIFKVTNSSTSENEFTFQIASNANNNTITTDDTNSYFGTVTDDTSETYSWTVWDPYTAFTMKAAGTEVMNYELDFGDNGFWFPNLAMHTLSTSATFELYVL